MERRELFILDSRNAIRKALQQGLQQGRQEGMREQAIAIARNLLNLLDIETISRKTGLSVSEIENLAK